jgi:hypothetical protein
VKTKTKLDKKIDGERTLLLIAPLRCVINLGAILQENGEPKEIVIAISK